PTDSAKSQRVWTGLKKHLSNTKCNELYKSFLSELPEIEQILSDFIRYVFAHHKGVENDLGHPGVIAISQIAHKVHREKHRMEAFIRFQLTKDGIYFATISPDFNVIPLIVRHFKDRYADQRWLIYDDKRNYGIHYDPKTSSVTEVIIDMKPEAKAEFLPATVCHEDELEWQKLWKGYFTSVNIALRKNKKLHIQHVPMRYWKYLTEKRDL
ncbi:MAG TPA: TIGR03915 family putative DNA repair protein, partial [Chryseosolibacter sp.]